MPRDCNSIVCSNCGKLIVAFDVTMYNSCEKIDSGSSGKIFVLSLTDQSINFKMIII